MQTIAEKKQRVLLVEDNPINQKVAGIYLQRLGFDMEIAENGKIGVEKFSHNDYDIILMDINMPVMDGFQATFLIREIEKNKKMGTRTSIVAVTANAMKGDRERCLQVGMDHYISKPYLPSDLERAFQALKTS
ncbi:MAG: response regulator [Bacteroidales bacterium]|nr:response regulator [Bacteroidales bacterium]MCF8454641.1 response regulator [Bacteroidales bacterium]